jgi:N-succinyl-L-ornithine transcarbamylase
MKNFIDLTEDLDLHKLVQEAQALKKEPCVHEALGKRKVLGLLFFNPSLRTRLSTQKAAKLLGMEVMVMNFSSEAWAIEYEDGTVMSGLRSEHIREAAQVVSQYCDIVAIRAFASLTDQEKDESEIVLRSFQKYASVPIVNMESATAHPLQAVADAITLKEHWPSHKPKIVLSWAPHPKALPHAVANSFVKMMASQEADFVITHPKGYELDEKITKGVPIVYDQEEALKNADFVYVKNWASYQDYGKILRTDDQWMLTRKKLEATNHAKFMHCLPIRRNVVVSDDVMNHESSLVIKQANNRTYAAQAVLKRILDNE